MVNNKKPTENITAHLYGTHNFKKPVYFTSKTPVWDNQRLFDILVEIYYTFKCLSVLFYGRCRSLLLVKLLLL